MRVTSSQTNDKCAMASDRHGEVQSFCRKAIYLYAVCTSFLVLVADQILKWVMLEHVIRTGLVDRGVELAIKAPLSFWSWLSSAPEKLPFYTMDVLPFFNITMVWNHGVSFGLFASEGGWGKMMLILMALGISGFLTFLITRSQSKVEIFAMAVVIGGAIGNVIDRVRFGAVADFIDVHAYGHHFPVFNIADSAITMGVAFLIIYGLFFDPEHKRNNETKEVKK
jgi:signal peptidase II